MTDHAMKMPRTPPPRDLDVFESGEAMLAAISAGRDDLRARRYEPWDKVRFRQPPEGLSVEQWWHGIKLARGFNRQEIGLVDADGQAFSYSPTDRITEAQHKVDLALGGRIGVDEAVLNPQTRSRYMVSSLTEEAITSSLIEGAVATRERAKELIREDRRPRDRSERMILNNYLTMEWIKSVRHEPMTPELLCELQGRMTTDTLDVPEDAGRFRGVDRQIDVADAYGHTVFTPPPAAELPGRIDRLCRFANGEDGGSFVHPAVRSILLHFWLAFDHPFADGNGRTARALFYWSMLRHGYWMFEYISISPVILQSNKKYDRAFLHAETDGNDLNYFLHYHLDVVEKAAENLHAHVKRKVTQTRGLDELIRAEVALNHRQRALLSHALRHPGQHYTVESHEKSNQVANQTARNDLNDLVERGLFVGSKRGRTVHFRGQPNLEKRLREI